MRETQPTLSRSTGTDPTAAGHRPRGDGQALAQGLFLLAVWLMLVVAFRDNDGLWFQGDAPRHALNGVFWLDLACSDWKHPVDYAWGYYARYPALSLTNYPPVYHLVSAVGYAIFGLTPWVPKGVSLLSSLALVGWVWLWLRRWVSASSGWLAASLFLMPGIFIWMQAGMTNLLATALGMGALYHLRRALEQPSVGRRFWLAIGLATLAVLTHPLMAILGPVGLMWILLERGLGWLWRPTTLWVWLGFLLLLIPVFVLLYQRGNHFRQAQIDVNRLWDAYATQFYVSRLHELPGIPGLILTAIALLGCLPRLAVAWRELKLVVVWLGVCLLLLTLIWAKDVRYALIGLPAVVIALAVGCREWHRNCISRLVPSGLITWFWSGLAVVAGLGWMAQVPPLVPNTLGMREIVAEVLEFAPRQPVFYYGELDGLLIYYLRLADPGFQQQVIPAAAWVGADPEPDLEKVRQRLLRSGVKWLLVERPLPGRPTLPNEFVNQLCAAPGIEKVRILEFSTRGTRRRRVAVYAITDQPPGTVSYGPEGCPWDWGSQRLTPLRSRTSGAADISPAGH
ncbi:MAG: ArnT family glycosyltransferase [Planctomycetaceae bacterium]|jgi:hypothetical protein